MNKNYSKRGWIIFLLFIGVVVGGYFYLNSEDNIIETTQNSTNPADDIEIDESISLEEINLQPVNDYSGKATATRTINEQPFVHKVFADLDDPAEGKFYEGWLVGPSIVSTGELSKNSDGIYIIEFSSDEDLSEHDDVVITEETLADGLDGKPEAHVLEGSF